MSDTWDAFPEAKFAPGPAQTVPGVGGAPTKVIIDTGGGAAPAPDDWNSYPEANPVTPGGMAKAYGVGAAQGVIGIPGMAGDIVQLGRTGVEHLPETSDNFVTRWLRAESAKVAPGAATGARGDQPGTYELPTSHDIQGAVENVTGPFRKPQNQAEEDAATAGQFTGSAILNPGGVFRKAVQAVVPAGTTIVAGRYSDQNPYVKALAGLVGGVGAGYFTAPGAADKLLRSKLPSSITEQHITDAGQLIERAGQRGVNLTWPEALSQVSGQPIATDLQRVLESHPQTRAQMQEFMAPRAGQVEQAARSELGNIAPYPGERQMIGPQAGNVAEKFTDEVQQMINKASAPYYKAAEGTLFNPQEWQAIRQIPNFDKMLAKVRKAPDAWRISHLPDNSLGVLDAIKKQFRTEADAAASAFNPRGANKGVSSSHEMGESAVKQIGVAKSSNYEQALDIQNVGREQVLEPLMRGPIGQIAKSDMGTDTVIRLLFGEGNRGAGTEQQVSQAVKLLSNRRPAVAEAIVRAHIEDTIQNAVTRLQGGGNQFAGARLAKDLVGHPQEHANLKAAVEALPNGRDRWDSLEKMLEIMQATGQRQAKGSLTAFNAMDLNQMSSAGLASLVAKGASPSKWMKLAEETYQAWSSGKNLDRFAQIITDPRSGPIFQRLRKIDPNSNAAVDMVGRLIAHVTASTTAQRVR